MPQLKIFLLGLPRVEHEGESIGLSRRKAFALLAYLAVNANEGQAYSRDYLAATIWADHDEQRARNELRRVLVVLNKTPISKWLEVDRKSIRLVNNDDLWVDTRAFTTLLEGNPSAQNLEAALALYQGIFMEGFTLRDSTAFDDWQSLQTQTFQQQYISALEQLVRYDIGVQNLDRAMETLQNWLEADPLYEPAQRQLMRAYVFLGQRAAALSQYDAYTGLLERELAAAPQEETVALYEKIRANQPVRLEEHVPPVFGNLPPMPALVIGRGSALNALKSRLNIYNSQPANNTLIVQGWPGIGKTTISALLAHDPETHNYFTDGVLWTSLGEMPNLFSELLNWGNALGVDDLNTLNTIDDLTSRLGALLRDKRMLIIVDDAWDAAHVMPFRVGGRGCALLVTTRLNDVAQALATSQDDIYKLPILAEDDSVALLQRLAPDAVAENPTEVRDLVRDLEGLPLALQVSGRLLRAEMSMGWGVKDLLHDLREGTRLLEAKAPPDRTDVANETTPTIATLLKYSTDRLDEATREKFALLGVFAPKPATFDLGAMQAVWMVDDARPVTRELVARGLLEPLTQGRFQMHALLVTHAKSMFAG